MKRSLQIDIPLERKRGGDDLQQMGKRRCVRVERKRSGDELQHNGKRRCVRSNELELQLEMLKQENEILRMKLRQSIQRETATASVLAGQAACIRQKEAYIRNLELRICNNMSTENRIVVY